MDTEARNLALVRRWVDDVINRRDVDAVEELFSTDYVGRLNGDPLKEMGPAHPRMFAEAVLAQFPDVTASIEDAIACGDRVVLRTESRGTHVQTGRTAVVHGIWVVRIADGRIAEGWATYDTAPLLHAAGYEIVPPKGQ